MKKLLLNFILIALPLAMFAQVPSGTKLAANITGTDVISDGAVDVQAWLDDDKTVILDVFATWCGPCWSFHQSKYLEELYAEHGPEGDNTIRILAIEGDSRTTAADVVGTGNNTLGNWTEGVLYNMIDDDSHNGTLNIAYYPTLYIIRPDGTIIEMGDFRGNDDVWNRILFPVEKDAIMIGSVESATFCDTYNYGQSVPVVNLGSTTIEEGVFEVKVGDDVQEVSVSDLGVFETANIVVPPTVLDATTEISISQISLDGVASEAEPIAGTVYSPVTNDQVIKLLITTDAYPGEFSWTLTTEFGDELASDSYQAGTGTAGQGGPDANKTFEYEVWIGNTDVECLSVNLSDSYGDGIPYGGGNGTPLPGVVVETSDGTVIKPWILSDAVWASSQRISIAAELSPSNTNLEDVITKFDVYPNPTSGIINLDINTQEDFQIEINDFLGKKVLSATSTERTLDVTSLTAGTYLISLRTAEGVMTKKFTKI